MKNQGLVILCINFLVIINSWGQSWQPVGDLGFGSYGNTLHQSLAVYNDTPFVAYIDGAFNNNITVKKFNGNIWETVGYAGFITTTATVNWYQPFYPKIDINSHGEIYVSYNNQVKKFNGVNWITVGNNIHGNPSVDYLNIKISNQDTVYAAFSNEDIGKKLTVKKFNGINWVDIGGPNLSDSIASYISLIFDDLNNLYVSYSDRAQGGKLTIKKFDGNIWTTIGNAGFSLESVSHNDMTVDTSGNLCVAYYKNGASANNSTHGITVEKFNGSNWQIIGDTSISDWYTLHPNIIVDDNNILYLSYGDGYPTFKTTIKKFNGGNWSIMDTSNLPKGDYQNLAKDNLGNIYFACQDSDSSTKLSMVAKLNSNNWTKIGNSFASKNTWYQSLTTFQGTPYIAFSDHANGQKTSVMKFNGNSWVYVGSPSISLGESRYQTIAIDSNGVVYVAYSDYFLSGKTSVMKFENNYWSNVGALGFSSGYTSSHDLEIGLDQKPYLAFQNREGSKGFNAVQVVKFENGNWVYLADSLISTHNQLYHRIKLLFDKNQNIWISYINGYFENSLYKFDNISWSNIPIPSSNVTYPDITLDKLGNLYMIQNINSQRIAYKFDGNNWSSINVLNPTLNIGWGDILINDSLHLHTLDYDAINNCYSVKKIYNNQVQSISDSCLIPQTFLLNRGFEKDKYDNLYVFFQDPKHNSGNSVLKLGNKSTISIRKLEQKEDNLFVIFPNPNSGSFMVKYKENSTYANIKIFDVLGREIYNQEIKNVSTHQIYLENLNKGIYFISSSTKTQKQLTKFIVN